MINSFKSQKGELNSNYKDGRTIKSFYCIKCNKVIQYSTWFFGSKMCQKCYRANTKPWNYREKPTCSRCGKTLKCKGSKLCFECYKLFRKESPANNPTYKEGLCRIYPSEFNFNLKEKIRKRDKYICQLCLKPSKTKRLHVHHITYNKNNLKFSLLISLCTKCHTWTNVIKGTKKEISILLIQTIFLVNQLKRFNTYKSSKYVGYWKIIMKAIDNRLCRAWDLWQINQKLEYNKTRPKKHGKKF